jgi:hypothetical protein
MPHGAIGLRLVDDHLRSRTCRVDLCRRAFGRRAGTVFRFREIELPGRELPLARIFGT